jgi:hypothetical protein
VTADRPNLVDLAVVADQAVFAGEEVPEEAAQSVWKSARAQVDRARSSVPGWRRWMSQFRVRAKRGLPPSLTSIDTAAVSDRVKEMVNR